MDVRVSDSLAATIQARADESGSTVSDVVRHALQLQVREPAPHYRFQGMTGHCLIRDMATVEGWGSTESAEADTAADRLRAFSNWSETVAFAPQSTSTASEIVPPGYRAAVTIPLTADRPLALACTTLPIQNAAPFTVPHVIADDTVDAARAEGSNPTEGTPVWGDASVTPKGLAGMLELTRELVDSATPGGDLIALAAMREDWQRQAEIRIYAELNSANGAGGTITSGFVPSGAMAVVSTTPASNLYADLRKQLARFANVRRRKPRNTVAGAAALDHLAGLITFENGDDTALWRVLGARVNAAVNTYGGGAGDARVLTLGADDVVNFESPLASFRFDEAAGPALIRTSVWAYHAVAVVRAVGISAIRFT